LLRTESAEPGDAVEGELELEGHWEGEAVHYKLDGTRMIVDCQWALRRGRDGVPTGILAINNDITERKRAEDKLQLLTNRLSLETDAAQIGVWDWELANNTLTWDAVMFDIYHLPRSEVMQYEQWSAMVHPEDLPAAESTLQRVIREKGEGSAEFRITLPDGTARIISAVERAALDQHANVTRVIGVNMDITERKTAEQALRNSEAAMTHSAEHDFLTGLPNRMLLRNRIQQAITLAVRHKQHVAVLFLDLDGFKHVNDSLGHPIGDRLLQSVSKRLLECVRASDTVSRLGGDEFVVLLSEAAQPEDAATSARRILQSLAKPHAIDPHLLQVSTSIGISVYPEDGLAAETLIKNADMARYRAKANGHQGYRFFNPQMNAEAVEQQSPVP
jgi:diguanylate cyclase (GGDEF)-like protein/PAS domain S-box-containing protein